MARRIRGGFVEHKAACRMCASFAGQWIKDDIGQRTNWFDKITEFCCAQVQRGWLQWSELLCLSLSLSFLSGDPRLPDIAGIQTRFSRRGQIDYGFDARGLCVLGTSLFWKVPTWTCSNKLFFSTHALGKHFHCLAQFIDSVYPYLHKEWRTYVWGRKTWQSHSKPASQCSYIQVYLYLCSDISWT
jgi:hypothetical protein